MTVTRAERNVLYELAGAPALQRLSEVVSAHPPARRRATARGLQLGVVVDEYADVHPRGAFLVRGILDADEATARSPSATSWRSAGPSASSCATPGRPRRTSPAAEHAGPGAPRGAAVLVRGRGARVFGRARTTTCARCATGSAGRRSPGFFAAGEIGPVGGRNHLHGHSAAVLAFG